MTLFSAKPDGPAGYRGEIIGALQSPVLECRVIALSPTGATLAVPAGTAVPDAIMLAITGEFVMRRCRVVWRASGRLRVAFERPV